MKRTVTLLALAGYDGKVAGPYEDLHDPLISPDGTVRGWIAIIDEKYTVFLNGRQVGNEILTGF